MIEESYRDPCPKCGQRLLGFSKEDYIEHLRQNGETLAAEIEEKMVVEEPDCAGTNQQDGEEFCADAIGYQEETCVGCGDETMVCVKAKACDNGGTIAKKRCRECKHEWTETTTNVRD